MDVIDIIKSAAAKSSHKALEAKVFLDSEISLMEFTDTDKWSREVIDVNVTKIEALNRGDFWETGSNWCQALDKLSGKGWNKNVFDYFRSPVADKHFPAPNSLHELKLSLYGEAAYECSNGNHRLVAAKCWLLSKYPNDALLRQVNVIRYPVYPLLVPLIEELIKRNLGCFVSRVHSLDRKECKVNGHEVQCLFMPDDNSTKVYAWTGEQVIEIGFSKLIVDKFLRRLNCSVFFKKWSYCPNNVLQLLVPSKNEDTKISPK
jgi:hypothetical protein